MLECSAVLEGEYGLKDVSLGIPVAVGAEGIKEYRLPELTEEQAQRLEKVSEAMKEIINPNSLEIRKNCYVEKFAATLPKLSYLQFQRIGYFNIDNDSTPDQLVFNRTVGLKDTWSKINK